jgi:hypothetical protein
MFANYYPRVIFVDNFTHLCPIAYFAHYLHHNL